MKKNNNRGNALVLVIVVLALVIIFTGTIFTQINNQIKSNQNSLTTVDAKYAAEAGIENTISQIIEQIEFKVNNYPQSSSKLLSRLTKSKNDDFAIVKNELINAYDKLQGINNSYGVLNDVIINLYDIISNNYSSVQQLQSDIYDLKYKLIWDTSEEWVTTTENDSIRNEIKDTVYLALSDISNSLVKIYSSDEIHKDHKPLYIEGIKDQWSDRISTDSNDIYNKFIKNYNDSNHSYTVESIQQYISNELKNSIYDLANSITSLEHNSQQTLVDKVNTLGHTTSQKLLDYINNGVRYEGSSYPGNTYNFIKFQYLSSTASEWENTINTMKSGICDSIDIAIQEKIYNDLESELYKIYIEYFYNYKSLNTTTYEKLKKICLNLEAIKINLIELKCKLGYTPVDIDGEVTLPDPPGTINPPDNGDDIPGIYVELPSYTYPFEDNYGYYVEAIERTPIVLSYSNNEVQSVDDISIEIISTGTNRGKKYKIKSKVIFKTQKTTNGEYRTNYSIKTHDKI